MWISFNIYILYTYLYICNYWLWGQLQVCCSPKHKLFRDKKQSEVGSAKGDNKLGCLKITVNKCFILQKAADIYFRTMKLYSIQTAALKTIQKKIF